MISLRGVDVRGGLLYFENTRALSTQGGSASSVSHSFLPLPNLSPLSENGQHIISVPPSIPDVVAVMNKLYIQTYEDWYFIPKSHVSDLAGQRDLVRKYNSVEELTKAAFPDHHWQQDRFISKKGINPRLALQGLTERVVRSLFPDKKIQSNVREKNVLSDSQGRVLEIDIYMPELRLGFEYQETHHFFASHYGKSTLVEYQERDRIKKKLALENDVVLITIPFWWDFNKDSLAATIKQARPDLLQDIIQNAPPISDILPADISDQYKLEIPGLGIPTLVLHAPMDFDPTGWWIFEKYDGIRAVWNAKEFKFYSRHGKPVEAMSWMNDVMPVYWLDGEIWFGDNSLTEACRLVSASNSKVAWQRFHYMVFDAPLVEADYQDRYKSLQEILNIGNGVVGSGTRSSSLQHPFVHLAHCYICKSKQNAEDIFNHLLAVGAEGIITRQSYAIYAHGYSHDIYKYKKYRDAEAMVVKQVGNNRWLCKIDTNTYANNHEDVMEMTLHNEFVGDQLEIQNGTVVSYKFTGNYTKGKPMNPRIYCVRKDIQNWRDRGTLTRTKQQSDTVQRLQKPRQYGSWELESQRRKFFDTIAREMKFDPLDTTSWYNLSSQDVLRKQGGMRVLTFHQYSLAQALVDLYPELNLDKNKFKFTTRDYWRDPKNRREFFDRVAEDMGFSPSDTEKWYGISLRDITKYKKGGRRVCYFHKGSYTTALVELYPELNLLKHKFTSFRKTKHRDQHRQFFEQYAHEQSFDPSDAESWYTASVVDVRRKGGARILEKYNDSLPSALTELFPELRLVLFRFRSIQRKNIWQPRAKQRQFFSVVAKKMKFDPLDCEAWYKISAKDVSKLTGSKSVLSYYQGSFVKALVVVFPELNFDASKFKAARNK